MGIFQKLAILALALLAPLSALAAKHPAPPAGVTRTAPWNSDKSDLPADDSIIYGVLPNGLRYAIRPNNRPQNQVLVRMAFDFGSAAEAEDEQGLAHFIEHMAFNGTTNVPEGEMVKMLERLGLKFGADTNASTGFTMTDYRLDLPKADPALIERALFLMRETASEMLIDPEAVDRERGVVLAEMRQRDNFQYQRDRMQFRHFYPGTWLADRWPIGTREVLEKASAAQMQALYRRWYVPDRARLVIVGPVDPVAIEREIVSKFASWKGSGKALGQLDRCSVDTGRIGAQGLFVHPQINEQLTVQQLLPDGPRPDTFETNLMAMKMSIAATIISNRLARRARIEDLPLLGGGTSFETGFCDSYARIGFSITGKDGSWQKLMPIAEQAVRQAVEHGFTEAEIAEQLQRLDRAFENDVQSEPTRPSGYFAGLLTRLDDENVISSAVQGQMIWRQIRPFITTGSVGAEFAKWFGRLDNPAIFLSTPKGEGVGETALPAAFAASRALAVAPPEQRETQSWAYTDFGAAGEVVEDKRIADLDIRTIRFANGVLLNLKKTDFEKDRIRWSVRVDGGSLHLPREQQYLASFMDSVWTNGGLGKHQIDDLRALLAGSTAAPGLFASEDVFGASGAIASKALDLQMQLTAAYLTDPGKREEAVRQYRRGLPEWFARREATPQAALGVAIGRIMTDSDPRFSLAPQEAYESADFAMLEAALGDALRTNRMEIALVGDLDEEAAIAAVARTFGALPKRNDSVHPYSDARQTRWSDATGVHEIPHKGEPNQLSWRRIWTTTDASDQRTEQAMMVFAAMAQIRLIEELRERLGKTYGVFAGSSMSRIYPGRGTFTISTDGDPKDLADIEAAVDTVMAEMLDNVATDDLFERARKPTLQAYADWKRQNGTWLDLAARAQTDPDMLQRFRDSEAQFQSLTAEEVLGVARRWLLGKQAFTFRALPAAMP